MQLTLDSSLRKIKDDCESVGAMSAVLAAEESARIASECTELAKSVDCALEVLGELKNIKYSLEASGYSDIWFDTVKKNNVFNNLVELDMPKFFDNPKNREQACMEGIGETILDWLKKAWEAIKKFFAWIRDCIHRVFTWMGLSADKSDNIARRAAKFIDNVNEEWLANEGIQCENLYNVASMSKQLKYVKSLILVITAADFRNDARLNGDQVQDAHRLTMDLVRENMENNRIPTNNMKMCGFEIRNGNLVFMKRSDITNYLRYDKYDVIIKTKAELQKFYDTVYTDFLGERRTTRNLLENADAETKDWEAACKNQFHNDQVTGNISARSFNTYKLAVESTKIMAAALSYMTLIDNMARALDVQIEKLMIAASSTGATKK